MKYPIVTSRLMPKLSDSMKIFSFLSQARRLPSVLRNLMFPRVQLLSTWQPMQMCVLFCFSLRVVDTLKNFLNSFLPVGITANMRLICLLLAAVRRTKDGLSLSIAQKSCFIATIGLNFAGAIGVGKNMQNTRLRVAGVLEEAVRAMLLAREGLVAVGAAMVERGESVIDPRRLT